MKKTTCKSQWEVHLIMLRSKIMTAIEYAVHYYYQQEGTSKPFHIHNLQNYFEGKIVYF